MTMKKEEAKQKTIATLMRIARKHFTTYGYYDVSLEKIAIEANVTRGALYHHFKNKRGLFLAVLDLVQKDVAEQIENEAKKSDDPWYQLILGCIGFIHGANSENCRQILLVDAPVVVGWQTWRKADQENSMDVLQQHIIELKTQGYIDEPVNIQLMTYAISGALNELALNYSLSQEENDTQILYDTLAKLVEGYRNRFRKST